MPGPAITCPHCAQPLDALARRLRKPHCGAAACRQRAEAAGLKARWKAVAELAKQHCAKTERQPGNAPPTPPALLWLRPANRELEAVSDALRQSLADAWRKGAAEGWRHVYEGIDSAQTLPTDATVLCAFCGGGCCAHGAKLHAFIDADVLTRWVAAHPGSSTEDAIQAYLAQLPAEHVQHGCGFQTATGCALPREARADVCNRYACEPLLALGDMLHETPARAAVVLTPDRRRLERAALLQHGRITPITGLPDPDDLPPPA